MAMILWRRRMLNSVLLPITAYLFAAGLPEKICIRAVNKKPFRGTL
jgi:hypothetical protein